MAESVKINFTKKELEGIEPPQGSGKQVRYYDTKTRGLLLLVTSGGAKTFYVRRKVKGRSELYALGRFPELSVEQARAKAGGFHSALTEGKSPTQARRAERAEFTLGELFNEYLERHLKKSRKGWKEQELNFERNFGPWRSHKLSTISKSDIEKLHGSIGSKRGQYAANRAIDLLRAMYNKGISWQMYSGPNQASGISEFTERPRDRVLQAEEVSRFIAAVESEQDENLKDFVRLCLFTGQRKTNILSMRWDNIDLKGRVWNIPGEKMKNNQSHTLALSSEEVKLLKKRAASPDKDEDWVFPGIGKTGHYVEPKRAWKRLIERAKIENLHIHDLRRSLASFMANSGADVSMIKSALNHKDIKTTLSAYVRTTRNAELEAREKAHNMIKSLIKKGKNEKSKLG